MLHGELIQPQVWAGLQQETCSAVKHTNHQAILPLLFFIVLWQVWYLCGEMETAGDDVWKFDDRPCNSLDPASVLLLCCQIIFKCMCSVLDGWLATWSSGWTIWLFAAGYAGGLTMHAIDVELQNAWCSTDLWFFCADLYVGLAYHNKTIHVLLQLLCIFILQ